MGNKQCCVYRSSKSKSNEDVYRQSVVKFDDVLQGGDDGKSFSSQTGVRHISERENFPEGNLREIMLHRKYMKAWSQLHISLQQ